jgi:hypothetical protein
MQFIYQSKNVEPLARGEAKELGWFAAPAGGEATQFRSLRSNHGRQFFLQ